MASRSAPYEVAAEALIRESGVTVRSTRSGMTGSADIRSRDWEIEVPEPRGPISFGVFAHEVAHQMLHRYRRKARWREEVEAEDWALEQFDRFGLAGRERYQDHAAKHLAHSFAKAIRRSPRLAAVISETYPEWWTRALAADARALRRPSMSRERRALDLEGAEINARPFFEASRA